MPRLNTNNSTIAIKAMCAIIFLGFTFSYLYFYQADVLALVQHVLSNGRTTYNPLTGGVIITILLYLLQWLVVRMTKLRGYLHAITYFPSLLILIVITDINKGTGENLFVKTWLWLFPLLIILYILGIKVIKRFTQFDVTNDVNMLVSKILLINISIMVCMFFMVGLLGCNDDVFHYRLRAGQYLLKGDYDDAIKMGALSQRTDSSLTAIRAYALSNKDLLSERLFEHRIVSGAKTMFPNGINVRLLLYPESKIYTYLGLKFDRNMSSSDYLRAMANSHKPSKQAVDYLLCGYLLDKDLDSFVLNIGKYYKINEHLPKHYREALTLYTHLRSRPTIVFHGSVMDADFSDYQTLEHKNDDNKTLQQSALRDTYGNTYWYYYQYAPLVK